MAPGTTQLQPSESEQTVSCVSSQAYFQRATRNTLQELKEDRKTDGAIVIKEHSSAEALSRCQLHDR